jgi:hypothetical protein
LKSRTCVLAQGRLSEVVVRCFHVA